MDIDAVPSPKPQRNWFTDEKPREEWEIMTLSEHFFAGMYYLCNMLREKSGVAKRHIADCSWNLNRQI